MKGGSGALVHGPGGDEMAAVGGHRPTEVAADLGGGAGFGPDPGLVEDTVEGAAGPQAVAGEGGPEPDGSGAGRIGRDVPGGSATVRSASSRPLRYRRQVVPS